MKYTTTYIKIVWIWLFFGIGGFLYPNYTSAFSGPTFTPAQMEYIEINATVMEVNIAKSYVVVAEKWFDITEFKIGDEVHKTALKDADGEDIPLKSLKEGQRVVVKGIKLSTDKFIAERIQIKASGNEGVKPYQFIPKAQSINPLR